MQKRSSKLLITSLVVLAIISLGAWVSAPSLRRSGRRLRPERTGMANVVAGGGGFGRGPRYLASHADKAGPYYVSYRFVRSVDAVAGAIVPPGRNLSQLGPFYLGIQVTPAKSGQTGFRIERDYLRAVDDRGTAIGHRHSEGDSIWPYQDATIDQAYMDSPAPGATALRSLEGRLSGTDAEGATRVYSFRIENIPLPGTARLFGRIAFVRLSKPIPGSAIGVQLITNERAGEIIRSSEPITTTAPAPQFLLFGDGLPTTVRMDLGKWARTAVVTASRGDCGSIMVSADILGVTVTGTVWDGDRFLITLPETNGRPVASVMQITRDINQPVDLKYRSPYPAESGSHGGSISSGVKVGERPFGRGEAGIRIGKLGAPTREDFRTARVGLDSDGRFALPNLAPGDYRLEFQPDRVLPYFFPGEPRYALAAYMRSRFQRESGAWGDPSRGIVRVRAGQITDVQPLVWQPN